MQSITDPAKELAEMCAALKGGPQNVNGADYLAGKFSVKKWSAEFYQLVFAITKRFDDLAAIVKQLDMDEDLTKEAVAHIRSAQNAFGEAGLRNQWKHAEENYLTPANLGPIKMLSPHVRAKVSYPKLSEEELKQVIAEVTQLKDWLVEHQLAENDFIRQALIEGVEQLLFRLDRIGWLGWGYTLDSLRDVISAYMFLETASPDLNAAPDAGAALAKTRAVVSDIFEKTKMAKEVWELGKWGLKAYGTVALIQKGAQTIAGLLT